MARSVSVNLSFPEVAGVVLAGGLGTRLRGILRDLPKPMAPVAGRPFLDWILEFLSGNGLTRVIVSTGYGGEIIEKHLREHSVAGLKTFFVRETEQLGTAGGLANSVNSVADRPNRWLVCNGDSLALAPLTELVNALEDPVVEGAILGLRVPDASRFGTMECDGAGNLVRFAEKQSGPGTINAGVYFLRDELMQTMPGIRPLSLERDVFPDLIKQGRRLRIVEAACPFIDIGTPESIAQAEGFIRTHRDLIAAGGGPVCG